jgi:GNAT superfamily N-acetyltransferase
MECREHYDPQTALLRQGRLVSSGPVRDVITRPAEIGDVPAVDELLAELGQTVEPGLAEAIEAGAAGANIAKDPAARERLIVAALRRDGTPFSALPGLSLLLVAEDGQGQPVGALQALVPGQWIAGALDAGFTHDLPWAMANLITVTSLVVAPTGRRRGIGRMLLERCVTTYSRARYTVMWGAYRERRQLEAFYRTCGFDVRERVDVGRISRRRLPDIHAAPGERLFVRHIGRGS